MPKYVDKYYAMNPETDDLLYCHQLRNGMVVLTASDNTRQSLHDLGKLIDLDAHPAWRSRANMWNRWTTVTQLEREDDMIYFIGLFDDGTKARFGNEPNTGWYVKKDTIPTKDEKFEECEFYADPDQNCAGEEVKAWMVAPNDKKPRMLCDYHIYYVSEGPGATPDAAAMRYDVDGQTVSRENFIQEVQRRAREVKARKEYPQVGLSDGSGGTDL